MHVKRLLLLIVSIPIAFSFAAPAFASVTVTWVDQTPSGSAHNLAWSGITSSGDGMDLAAVVTGGDIWTSSDGGTTWIDRTTSGSTHNVAWMAIASSESGAELIAAGANGLWTSTDSGVTWTNNTPQADSWNSVASSYDGVNLVASNSNASDIWTSTNSGANWTDRAESTDFTDLSITEDGSKIAVMNNPYGIISLSVTGWGNVTNGPAASDAATAVEYSADGTKLYGSDTDIWVSTNDATSWTNLTTGKNASGYAWKEIVTSANGSVIAAFETTHDDIWVSNDSGVTWTNTTTGTSASGQTWISMAISADGSKIAAVASNGDVWITSSVPTITTQSAATSSQTAMIGNGTITATGGINPTVRGFVYGATSDYGATTTISGSFSAGAFTGTIPSLACNTPYHYAAYATNSSGTAYGSDSTFTTPACSPVVTSVSVASSNASTTLAKTGDTLTLTFTSDQASLIAPSVSILGHATTTAINTSGHTWTATTMALSGDAEGTVPFFIAVGDSDGYGTTTASSITTGANIRFDKTAPVITVNGANPDTVFLNSQSYTDPGASATDSYDGAVSVNTSGSVNTNVVGSYTLTYSASDAAGNAASSTRTVNVVASQGGGGIVGSDFSAGPAPVALADNGGAPALTDTGGSSTSIAPIATSTAASSTVASLTAQLQALYQKIKAMQAATTSSATFSRDLQYGDHGADVLALQQFLNTNGYVVATSGPGSPGEETGYFGSATRKSLIAFQKALGIMPTAGYFGAKTRAIILEWK